MMKFKSDFQIKSEFRDMKIQSIKFNSNRSGFVDIYFPYGEESTGGGAKNVVDNFIIYSTGKIAFSNWYPEDIYWKIVMAILNKEIL